MVRSSPSGPPPETSHEDAELLRSLRAGDERAFTTLVDRYGPSLLRVAMLYVPTRAVAEEVVQETWLGVLTGIERFEGRSSLKTWLFRILSNRAKTRGERERRTVPVSTLASDGDEEQTAVEIDRAAPRRALGVAAAGACRRSACSRPRPARGSSGRSPRCRRTSAP